ncbi:MAG TPA: xanthine dehydrogenase family protein molybdopterin-binding subunit [Alphaproteobacteria bacterium]|nr:xanthine dehydrogenase family protein molybdopterin-binding subunit [Alphaproteobacteria bacterium]
MGEYALGQPVARFEDLRLLRGGGRYIDDMALPGMAHGWVLRSPHAHARIVSIDTAKAKAAPGVLAVLTGADWQASGFGDLPVPGEGRRQRSGMFSPPYPALATDRVRWVGDYVAFVIADTVHHAMDAAELIEVDYEALPAVTATADAAAPGAPLVWDDCARNICFTHKAGDKAAADAAIASAPHVVSQRFVISRVTAATMEPRGCIGQYDRAADHYTAYTTLQRAHSFRAQLARTLRVTENRLRVVAGDIGGSFGMKSAVYNEVALTLLGSKLTGRPVKWISTRSDAFLSDAQGRDNVSEAELALDRDGKFLGLRVKTTAAVGAYFQTGAESSPVVNIGTLAGVYTTPAIHVDITAVFTHTHPMRPYRGNGRPEAAYVIERLIDLAADQLKLDPAEIRRRNVIPPSAMPYKTALTFTYDSGEFERNMDLTLAMADYAGFEARRAEAKGRGKLRGIGLSNSIEKAASPGYEGAEIRFDRGGTVTVLSGAVTQGQGHETVFKQLVCDRLGIDPKDVTYVQGDTDKVFFGEGTGGSRTATIGGAAVLAATDKIIAKGRRIAARMLETTPEDIQFDGGAFSTPKTNRRLTVQEVAKASLEPKNLPDGDEPGLLATAVFHNPAENFPNGCHICEVEIDHDTGTIEIVRYSVVDDVGTVLNPLLLKGQIRGGVAQGVGQILMEQIRYDGDGQLLTGSFMDYAMPHAVDLSRIAIKSNPVPTKTNPLGVKGAGEAGCVGALPAVANAIADALSPLGVTHLEMPTTPERVWRTIREATARA